jgi:hypothetical protein
MVKEIIGITKKSIKGWDLSSHKPSGHVMDDSRLFVVGTDINTLIAVNMVHPLVCLGAIHVPESKAFLSV